MNNCSACAAEGRLSKATRPLAVTVRPYILPGLTVRLCEKHNGTIATVPAT